MNVKIHYRVTREQAGVAQEFAGARHFVVSQELAVEDSARRQLAIDYQVALQAVEICRIEC